MKLTLEIEFDAAQTTYAQLGALLVKRAERVSHDLELFLPGHPVNGFGTPIMEGKLKDESWGYCEARTLGSLRIAKG